MWKNFFRAFAREPKLHLFAQKYSKNSEILLECKTDVFYVNMC